MTLLTVVVAITVTLCSGCSDSSAVESIPRSDILLIDGMNSFGDLDREAVQFPHDLHTEAVEKQGKDCGACHMKDESGKMSQLYMRLANDDKETVMNLYHDECIGCHNTTADANLASGPVACGECHREKAKFFSVAKDAGFDKSLHYRHIAAEGGKCDACHHSYDETAGKLVYIEGQENPCRDCHGKTSTESAPSFRVSAHTGCISCHQEVHARNTSASVGPWNCAGCHSEEAQESIAVIDPGSIPRLKRNQPDFVLLSALPSEISEKKLNTVPFSHIGHEGFTDACRSCHHQTLNKCNECHTLRGDETGGMVRLERAMHDMNSEQSCVGCHEAEKSTAECAGCHSLMEQGRLSEHACTICHAGPMPAEMAASDRMYRSLDDFRPDAEDTKLSFKIDEIPDSVFIGILAEKYDHAVMPHRLIVERMMLHISNSKIATYFHGGDDVVCQGCHHHSPVGVKPPLCENCHGAPFDEADPHKPGLYGAYHRQCIGCHEAMDIGETSDCESCHKQKSTQVGL